MKLIDVIEIDADYCGHTYGSAPCTAALDADNPDKCYNTRATCQDPDNYSAGVKTYRFCNNVADIPRSLFCIPSIENVSTSPARIDETKALGRRQTVSVNFHDHPHSDRGVDKYVDDRKSGAAQLSGIGFDPASRGTFWGKWRARNLYNLGRELRHYFGEIPSDPNVSEADFLIALTKRTYFIDATNGPASNARFTVEAKDPLTLTEATKAKAPLASEGEISDVGGIDETATSITLSPTGIGNTDYPASGVVAVGEELMSFTRSGDVLTVTRGQYNTVAEAHDNGAAVQLALVYDQESLNDIIVDLLNVYAGIPLALIDEAQIESEVDLIMPFVYSAVLPKPTGVGKYLDELAEQAGFSLYWDDISQTIKISTIKGAASAAGKDFDDRNILLDTMSVKDNRKKRVSQVWIHYGIHNPIDDIDDSKNYTRTYIARDIDAESDDQYGEKSVKEIFARWIAETNKSAAENLASRYLIRFRDIVREYSFEIPQPEAENIGIGRSYNIVTNQVQDFTGLSETVLSRFLAIESKRDSVKIEAIEQRFEGELDPNDRTIFIDTDINDLNFRDEYDRLFGPPTAATDITIIIESGVFVGASTPATPAFDVGDWSGYTYSSLNIINNGNIYGAGGDGGGFGSNPGLTGKDGGTGLHTDYDVNIDNQGEIAGGGGGGAGLLWSDGSGNSRLHGGGGGAGVVGGAGGVGAYNLTPNSFYDGEAGTATAGGRGDAHPSPSTRKAGDGGNLAQPGNAATTGGGGDSAGGFGAAGAAVEGDNHITYVTLGTITGARNS